MKCSASSSMAVPILNMIRIECGGTRTAHSNHTDHLFSYCKQCHMAHLPVQNTKRIWSGKNICAEWFVWEAITFGTFLNISVVRKRFVRTDVIWLYGLVVVYVTILIAPSTDVFLFFIFILHALCVERRTPAILLVSPDHVYCSKTEFQCVSNRYWGSPNFACSPARCFPQHHGN